MEKAVAEQAEAKLKALFKQMKHKIPLFLFSQNDVNEPFTNATRQVIKAVRQLTDQLSFNEYPLDHKLAQKWNVSRSPTILFDPDRYKIRWVGAPAGQESQTFVEILLMLGYQNSGLSNEAAEILNRIKEPRDVKVFVSLSCPYCPQQAVGVVRAAVARPDLVSAEIIDVQADTERAARFEAFSVPQTYANDKLIGQGAQSQELFLTSLEALEPKTIYIPSIKGDTLENDLVIVGGGPAGLTAGIYAVRAGLQAAVVERDVLGGQVATTPVVENYPGLTQVGGKALVDMLVAHALEYVNIFPGEEVISIQPGEPIIVKTNRRTFKTRTVLLATGAIHRQLGIPGETRLSGHGVSYCSTCDGPLFKGRKVLQIGGGNSAVTDALHMNHIGVDVTLVHRRDTLRAQEMLTRNLELNDIPVMYNHEVTEIQGKERVESVVLRDKLTGDSKTFAADGVFIAIGYQPAVELASKIGIALTEDGYIQHDERHRTNIPGIYSAGDVEGGFKQIVTAVGQGAEAAMSIFEDLINPYWKQTTP